MPYPEAMAVGIACVGARDHMPPHVQGSSVHSTVLPSLQQQDNLRVAEQQGMAAVLSQSATGLDALGSPSSSGKFHAGRYGMHQRSVFAGTNALKRSVHRAVLHDSSSRNAAMQPLNAAAPCSVVESTEQDNCSLPFCGSKTP